MLMNSPAVTSILLALLSSPVLALEPTPPDMEGPFYPDMLPQDQDNDLTVIRGGQGHAAGRVLDIGGRVLDTVGRPIPGVRVEIWQTDTNGRYIHTRDDAHQPRDPHFQGFGATVTSADGGYRFKTVVPRAYGSRPAHIHVQLLQAGKGLLITQLYFPGEVREPGLPARHAKAREAGQTLKIEAADGRMVSARFDFVLDK
jgi:protocatechuate 3,4-dioxygenase beta subunit